MEKEAHVQTQAKLSEVQEELQTTKDAAPDL